MAAQEDELKSLKEKNNELVQKVQYWKMTAAQRENEKLELMKEINELRLKVIRLKSGGAADARKLDAALQSASEQALSHLVQASSAVARTMELAKTYIRDREGADTVSPRWSSISNSTEKVHRVPPMMMGGQSIQPVVSLSRTTLNINTSRQTSRSPNSSRNVTVRAVPMHMLQDVYIPLTRLDMRDIPNNNESEPETGADDSGDNIPFDTSMEEVAEESQNMTNDEDYDSSRRLDIVTEDVEPESEDQTPPRRRARVSSPLQGPSWRPAAPRRAALEPDSTTADAAPSASASASANTPQPVPLPEPEPEPEPARMFTPTVRRRKRSRTPPPPPPPPPPPHTPNGVVPGCARVLQVLLPKLGGGGGGGGGGSGSGGGAGAGAGAGADSGLSPRKRRAAPRFDAPSPNGATDSRVIVSEELETHAREMQSGEPQTPTNKRDETHRSEAQESGRREHRSRDGRQESCQGEHSGQESYRRDSGDSDSGTDLLNEGRTRRNRKPVTYKEKPLNRKLRR